MPAGPRPGCPGLNRRPPPHPERQTRGAPAGPPARHPQSRVKFYLLPKADGPILRALSGQVAQSVEQGSHKPRVGGSIPPLATPSPSLSWFAQPGCASSRPCWQRGPGSRRCRGAAGPGSRPSFAGCRVARGRAWLTAGFCHPLGPGQRASEARQQGLRARHACCMPSPVDFWSRHGNVECLLQHPLVFRVLFGDRLMAGQWSLEPFMKVRILLPEP